MLMLVAQHDREESTKGADPVELDPVVELTPSMAPESRVIHRFSQSGRRVSSNS